MASREAEDIEYHDKINAKFSEVMFMEMASTRYGIEFKCDENKEKLIIKKELLDLAAIADVNAELG